MYTTQCHFSFFHEQFIQHVGVDRLRESVLGDLGIDRVIVLKWFFEKLCVKVWTGFTGCEDHGEIKGSVKEGNFLTR
jgi:hypothetical protein